MALFDLGLYPGFGAPGVYAETIVYKDEINVNGFRDNPSIKGG
jgi:hypothetical protein